MTFAYCILTRPKFSANSKGACALCLHNSIVCFGCVTKVLGHCYMACRHEKEKQRVQCHAEMPVSCAKCDLREGVEVGPMKTAAVQDWPTPRAVKYIRAFLGLASYHRRYIPNFASVATSLTDLTKKDVELIWDDNCEHAFQALKKALVQPPVLAYPTRDGHFALSMDASDTGMGAVLEQEHEEGSRVVKRVIAYASKMLHASQRRYCTTNKELLAVVTAIELFKYYLTGRHFTVVTDHASLTWLRNFKEPEGVVARWITRLQPFDFKIVHRPGKHHSHADGLSRRTQGPANVTLAHSFTR